jgi:hypothetical protein
VPARLRFAREPEDMVVTEMTRVAGAYDQTLTLLLMPPAEKSWRRPADEEGREPGRRLGLTLSLQRGSLRRLRWRRAVDGAQLLDTGVARWAGLLGSARKRHSPLASQCQQHTCSRHRVPRPRRPARAAEWARLKVGDCVLDGRGSAQSLR